MAALDIVYVLVASAILIAFVWVLWRTMLRRRALLLHDGYQAPPDDRAFNQIRIARAGARHLASLGHDVSGVNRRIDEAEERHRRGDANGALAIATSARTDLRGLQSATPTYGGRAPAPGMREAAEPSMPSGAALSAAATEMGASEEPAEAPPSPRPPPGLVQAKFTLSLLDQELAKAREDRGASPEVREAGRLRDAAQAEFDQGSFVPAWQDALRARRKLGSTVEAVGVRSSTTAPPAPSPTADASGRCPACGRPLRAGDRFCRGCGASVGASRCGKCAAVLDPNDAFCAVCGTAVGA
jgi:hypothetical protein